MDLFFTIGLTFPMPYPKGITLTGRAPMPETRLTLRDEVVEIRRRNGESSRATVQAFGKHFRADCPGPLKYRDRVVEFSVQSVPYRSWALSEVLSTDTQ